MQRYFLGIFLWRGVPLEANGRVQVHAGPLLVVCPFRSPNDRCVTHHAMRCDLNFALKSFSNHFHTGCAIRERNSLVLLQPRTVSIRYRASRVYTVPVASCLYDDDDGGGGGGGSVASGA
uniref:Putative secreted protein n=1 Tax=Anopheles darlingi TaxID=43151 RepID=A0A2M4DRE3_ANODA